MYFVLAIKFANRHSEKQRDRQEGLLYACDDQLQLYCFKHMTSNTCLHFDHN